MYIEVTDEMREAVRRVREAKQQKFCIGTTEYKCMARNQQHLANLVIAAIEAETAKAPTP